MPVSMARTTITPTKLIVKVCNADGMFAGGQIALQRHGIADVIEQVGNGDTDGRPSKLSDPAVGSIESGRNRAGRSREECRPPRR